MSQKTSVLIVGAGPTGLMMACQLVLLDIPFILVSKEDGPTTQSRALGIQARSLEIFRQMGIIKRVVTEGQPAKAVHVLAGKSDRRIPLGQMGKTLSEFSFLHILEQSKTEKIFVDFLKEHGKQVLWSTELITFTQDANGVIAALKHKNGEEQQVSAEYIVGADGAHSVVRHTLGIPLAGNTYKQSLFVLDCDVKMQSFQEDEIYLSMKENFVGFFPLKGGHWRVIGILPPEANDKKEVKFEDIAKDFQKRFEIDVVLSNPNWLSVYHSHHRRVSTFRVGRSFLAGDSAHIHSPVGAQGMNTGLQDAYNLAWKLAYVLQKRAKPSLLDTYDAERMPFAKRLVHTVDRVFNLVISKNPIKSLLVRNLVPFFMQFAVENKLIGDFIFRTVSEIGINYRHGSLTQNASLGVFSKDAPLPGDRLPYVLFTDENEKMRNIQEYILSGKMHLFFFSGIEEAKSELLEVAKKYDYIDVTTIPLVINTKELYEKFGIKTSGFYLVRPDMYISYRSLNDDPIHFEKYLNTFFIKAV